MKSIRVVWLLRGGVLAMVTFFSFSQAGLGTAEAAGPIPGMGIVLTDPGKTEVITSAQVGDKFAVKVTTNPAPNPGGGVGTRGFTIGVVIPAGGGIKYTGNADFDLASCVDEIQPPMLLLCFATHTATKHSINTQNQVPGALPTISAGEVGVQLTNIPYQCNTAGTYEITVIAADPLQLATAFYIDTNAVPIATKTVLDQSGGAVTASAKITCTPPPCADLDGDGQVTVQEIAMVAKAVGLTVPPAAPQVDIDGNTVIEQADVDFATSQFLLGPPPLCQHQPIGGIAELAEIAGTPLDVTASSGSNAGVAAGIVAAIAAFAVVLTGAAWYARRRLVS